jgi:uncharacterized protein (DUF427 family)
MPGELLSRAAKASGGSMRDRESVWDYPRPPRLEPVPERIRVVFNGKTVADTERAWRVLETSHPPVYYIPLADTVRGAFVKSARSSFCEWKGQASYYGVQADGKESPDAAWGYENPAPAFAAIRDHVAIYAGRMDACYVGDEKVAPQPGAFYGGWITSWIEGPFKGGPGTGGW